MKIVIDMTEDFYKLLIDKEFDKIRNINLEYIELVQKIKNGIPLPKGHGRLGDLDALDKDCESSEYHEVIASWLDLAPTIIEADAESEGEE